MHCIYEHCTRRWRKTVGFPTVHNSLQFVLMEASTHICPAWPERQDKTTKTSVSCLNIFKLPADVVTDDSNSCPSECVDVEMERIQLSRAGEQAYHRSTTAFGDGTTLGAVITGLPVSVWLQDEWRQWEGMYVCFQTWQFVALIQDAHSNTHADDNSTRLRIDEFLQNVWCFGSFVPVEPHVRLDQ